MASPAVPLPGETPLPPADPVAIRACLTAAAVAEFDAEWETVLEYAKQAKEVTQVHALLGKWRHIAHRELADPDSLIRERPGRD